MATLHNYMLMSIITHLITPIHIKTLYYNTDMLINDGYLNFMLLYFLLFVISSYFYNFFIVLKNCVLIKWLFELIHVGI